MRASPAVQWLSLVGVIWLQSINGTNSNFPAYSSQLKQRLSLSQLQLNNLALASDAGKLFGWFAGVAALYLPLWLVLLIGSTLGFVGYGLQYLFLTHHITFLPYWSIFLLTVVAGNGICWINTVCYLVTISNFPSHRQVAVGLTTSYLGLSPVVYTAFAGAFSSRRAQDYMLLNTLFPVLVCVVAAPFTRSVQKSKRVESGFGILFIITALTGIYAVVSSMGPMSSTPPWLSVMGIGLCLTVPLIIPVAEILACSERRVCDAPTIDQETPESGTKVESSPANDNKEQEEEMISVMEDVGVLSMIMRLNFWLYFLVYLTGATLGLVYLNNLGQIAESRGYTKTSSLVSLASAFVFFGRLFPPLLDYAFKRRSTKFMVPGPGSIAGAMVPMTGALFLLVINGSSLSLHVSTAVIGFSIGVITTISVSTTTELFGADNFGINHNVLVANIPLGSFLFGGQAALVYRKLGDGHGRCMGLQCYNMTFLIWGSLCSLGTVLALILHIRTRKFYSQTKS